ncbi:hypothetical protein [Streptomyces sp. FIT100]|uniref:hypothetical protein n=1 Tax=Streptomyces sp. FIT100 TaxID=2837956 RepID=UPI0021C5C162|nr:hypothetical protein [Streptomyces sp. FIT100]UUN28471.1 hypothetical protein KK483_20385 [Streptomyces sp. FIT100]
MSGRYGPVNQTQAQYGYHFMVIVGDPGTRRENNPPADEREAMDECSERAVETVPSFTDNELPDEIKQTSYIKAMESPDVVRSFGRWSECMSTAGYSYKSPMDAMRDPRWNWKSRTANQAEVAAALRDVECKKKFDVVNSWFQGEAVIQRAEIDRNKKELGEILSQIDTRDKAARKILDAD